MPDLLPCPFCGGEAEMFVENDNRIEPLVPGSNLRFDVFVNNEYFGVKCPKCDMAQTNPFIEREYAITAWNTRAAEARIATLEGALRRIADAPTAYDGGSIAECRRIARAALSPEREG